MFRRLFRWVNSCCKSFWDKWGEQGIAFLG